MILGVYGAGGLGREVYELALDVNKIEKKWDEFLFIDDAEELSGTEIYGLSVMKFDDFKGKYSTEKDEGYSLGILVHPLTRLSRWARIEEGAIITYGCNVSCDTHVKSNAFLQPSCGLGHDTCVGEDSVISACARIAGGATVGERVYVGMNAAVKEGTTIGNDVIIGMASVVHNSIADGLIVMGNPARPMRKNENHRVFGHPEKTK